MFHSSKTAQSISGEKTFTNDIQVDKLSTQSNQLSHGSQSFSSATVFDDEVSPNYVKRDTESATLSKDLIVDEKIELKSVKVRVANWSFGNQKVLKG